MKILLHDKLDAKFYPMKIYFTRRIMTFEYLETYILAC